MFPIDFMFASFGAVMGVVIANLPYSQDKASVTDKEKNEEEQSCLTTLNLAHNSFTVVPRCMALSLSQLGEAQLVLQFGVSHRLLDGVSPGRQASGFFL